MCSVTLRFAKRSKHAMCHSYQVKKFEDTISLFSIGFLHLIMVTTVMSTKKGLVLFPRPSINYFLLILPIKIN